MKSQELYETCTAVMSNSSVEGEDRKSEDQKSEVCSPIMGPDRISEKGNQKLEHRKDVIAPVVVQVSRPPEIEEKRRDLPIIMMEQEIMEAINANSVVILCGETGCGKTTQVPQVIVSSFHLYRENL
jgi:HrpA-like RNA helicase